MTERSEARERAPSPDEDDATRSGSPSDDDARFVADLREAGLLNELAESELATIVDKLGRRKGIARRIDLLEQYYSADGNTNVSVRRRTADRFFLHHGSDPATATELVKRLTELAPEIALISFERLATDDGPLVLRAGSHVAAVVDEYETLLDTNEVDLRELEETRPTVTVRGLVGALNILLDRHGISERLVPLVSDQKREAYAATSLVRAMTLCGRGYLEAEELDEIAEFTGW